MDKVILVVDDSMTVRKFVATSLQLYGFKVITASDGMEALEKMPSEKIDLIITDLNMPDIDGFEFVRSLRATPEYSAIPVIILSSITQQGEKDRAYKLGVTAYLEKPFSSENIRRHVARILKVAC